MTVQVEAYFDESGSHSGSHILCLAGYIIDKRQAGELARDWNRVLQSKGLPYFHMVDCAHGNGVFANLNKSERIEVQTRMIEIIKKRTVLGLAATVNSDEFQEIVPRHPGIGTPYSFLAHVVLSGVREWVERDKPLGEIAYFFEAGHASQSQANGIMEVMFSDGARREEYRYGGRGFVAKEDSPAIQAADLLAWHWYTDKRRELEGRPRRKDCESLLLHRHVPIHIGRERLLEMVQGIAAMAQAMGIRRDEVWLD